ncbi:YeaH/YhbH family protein [Chelatococcus asaccharovorans]|uniref:YeaH/YhbH family protein n=1 Tax=Chelatococcus asaccharovorans TaxID=28210 RepID=UPI00224C665D|nr:YeaH/YhbH family protein [Chelatococcus asaccharovorans]CAH1653235.1 DUF444 domain-containing protein YeaH [Chelatococcus asaccharovorans]CAH1693997.1 DUF444 domain-containing protein YeaH [Chelatococcus asaccharovorans]
MYIIDRRLNPGGKSFANRQRFLRRAKALVQRAVRDNFKSRSIKDLDQGGEIGITRQGVHEPTLRRAASGGQRDHVLPGNKDYLEGDTIPRPSGGGGGSGSQPGQGGDGEDEFRFVLTKEEYLDLFLDDLELPDLAKRRLMDTEAKEIQRAGYSTTGSPASLAVARTMRLSLARRLALRRPSASEILELEREIARLEQQGGHESQITALKEEYERLVRRNRRISYIDPIDLRYRRYESNPKPVAQAVMFCLMDVSGSMSEHMKDLAKRFFALLHLFLTRCYSHVDIVFIRHTDRAEEVDEQTFFYSTETGGTIVSTALEEMLTIMRQRYNPADWNIYVAQASDGDNMGSDSAKAATLLHDEILPACQYFAYLEVGREEDPMPTGTAPRPSDLWRTYETIATADGHFVMRKVWHRREIYPVFRELFRRRGSNVRGGAA